MRVLGIDPGYALVGFGVLDYNNYQNSIVDFGVVSTDKDEEMPDRLYFIYQGIKELIKKDNQYMYNEPRQTKRRKDNLLILMKNR